MRQEPRDSGVDGRAVPRAAIDPDELDAELDARLRERIADTVRRREDRRQQRQQFEAARAIGLQRRHHRKTHPRKERP